MSSPVLAIYNNHTPHCGVPPVARNSERTYIGYYENQDGEQWVFFYNRETKSGSLYGGDIDWHNPQKVRDGIVPGLNLRDDEAAWLKSCWNSATAKRMA
jgi:hypothetical protein